MNNDGRTYDLSLVIKLVTQKQLKQLIYMGAAHAHSYIVLNSTVVCRRVVFT